MPRCLERVKEQSLLFPSFLKSFVDVIHLLVIKTLQPNYESALKEITSPFETHPSLRDRVQALGGSLELKESYKSGVIQIYLKDYEARLELLLNGFNGHLENFAEHVEESKEPNASMTNYKRFLIKKKQ